MEQHQNETSLLPNLCKLAKIIKGPTNLCLAVFGPNDI